MALTKRQKQVLDFIANFIDPQHLSYLHRFLRDGANSRKVDSGLNSVMASDPSPEIQVAETAYGIRIMARTAEYITSVSAARVSCARMK